MIEDLIDDHDPAEQAEVAESVGAALLVVLDSLAPGRAGRVRAARCVRDALQEVCGILGRSPAAARQLASRARRRVRGTASTSAVDLVRQRDVVDASLRAAREGDFDALARLLDPAVVLRPDAAAQRMGTLREARGAAAVASVLAGGAQGAQLAIVDAMAALVWAPRGRIRGVIEFRMADDRIVAVDVIGDAERIRQLES